MLASRAINLFVVVNYALLVASKFGEGNARHRRIALQRLVALFDSIRGDQILQRIAWHLLSQE